MTTFLSVLIFVSVFTLIWNWDSIKSRRGATGATARGISAVGHGIRFLYIKGLGILCTCGGIMLLVNSFQPTFFDWKLFFTGLLGGVYGIYLLAPGESKWVCFPF